MAQATNKVIKGQNLRVMVGGKCVAYATSCNLEIKGNLEDASTKDSTGGWDEQELTGKSWTVSVDALFSYGTQEDNALNGREMIDAMLQGDKATLIFGRTTGVNNRSAATGTEALQYSGEAWMDSLTVKSENKANVTYTASFTGTGALTLLPTTSALTSTT